MRRWARTITSPCSPPTTASRRRRTISARRGWTTGRINFSQAVGRINAGLARRFGEGPLGHRQFRILPAARQKPGGQHAGSISRRWPRKRAGCCWRSPASPLRTPGANCFPAAAPVSPCSRPLATVLASRGVRRDPVHASSRTGSSASTAATHGTPYRYDTHVPIMLYGPPLGEARPRRHRRCRWWTSRRRWRASCTCRHLRPAKAGNCRCLDSAACPYPWQGRGKLSVKFPRGRRTAPTLCCVTRRWHCRGYCLTLYRPRVRPGNGACCRP